MVKHTQTICRLLPTNCLSVSDHFVGLALKELDLKLWHLFKYPKLVVNQNDKLFIDFLNKVRVCNIDDDVGKLIKEGLIHKSDKNYPKDALHMYVETEPAMERSDAVLNDLLGKLYIIETNDNIPDNCKYPQATIQVSQNQTRRNTSLAKLHKLKIGAKVMLTVNLDIHDPLINGQAGNINHIEFVQVSVRKVYVKYILMNKLA